MATIKTALIHHHRYKTKEEGKARRLPYIEGS